MLSDAMASGAPELAIILLARAWGCHPQAVLSAPAELVDLALQYEVYLAEKAGGN